MHKTVSTFDGAIKAWEELRDKEPAIHFDIVGWNHGVIANSSEVRNLFAQPVGTYKCPICYGDSPHTHSADETSDHRSHQQAMNRSRERRRAEILRIAAHIENTYGYPREAVAGDFGFAPTVGAKP
jgi:hypothetical protein